MKLLTAIALMLCLMFSGCVHDDHDDDEDDATDTPAPKAMRTAAPTPPPIIWQPDTRYQIPVRAFYAETDPKKISPK